MESPRRVGQNGQDRYNSRHESRTANTESNWNNASTKRRSMSRRRSWFGGKPDADEDVPAMPTLVRTDYNHNGGITSPTLGRSSRKNGEDYIQLPEDKRERKHSTYATRQNVTTLGALPPMPTTASYTKEPATSSLPAEQRRSRRQSMTKSLYRSNSQASTKSKRKSRSFWASSNPDDSDEDVPPVPALYSGASPVSVRNDPFDDEPTRGRGRTNEDGTAKEPRPVSTASRRSYRPKSAASGFLKSTNGASEGQRKSYRRSFNLGEGVELVCVTDEHRIEWEKLMNKHGKLDDSVFADSNKDDGDDEETSTPGGKNRFSNAQALAALEFGTRT